MNKTRIARSFRRESAAERRAAPHFAVAFWMIATCIFVNGCNESASSPARFQIASSSMAPRYYGPHFVAKCQTCSQTQFIASEAFDANLPTRCFACGSVCEVEDAVKKGDVVELQKIDERHPLRRFDVAVFTSMDDSSHNQLVAKRIWALPSEQIELRDGEAWVNGQLLQKSVDEFAEVCVPLSDYPKDSFSHWWLEDASHSLARVEDTARAKSLMLQPSHQLQFRYARPARDPSTPALVPSPFVDDYPCNQSSTAELHQVDDYLIAIELSKPSNSTWQISLRSGQQTYPVAIGGSNSQLQASLVLMLAICDGRLLVSTETADQQTPLADLNSPATSKEVDEATTDSAPPLITISTQQPLTIKRLIVARDLWLGPRENRTRNWTPAPGIDNSGYFVLGDNLPLSVDSRDSRVGRIAPNRITGRVNSTYPNASGRAWIQRLFQ